MLIIFIIGFGLGMFLMGYAFGGKVELHKSQEEIDILTSIINKGE